MFATYITLRPDWLLELNLVGASVAATASFYAAVVGDRAQRLKFILIGIFATIYTISDIGQAVSVHPQVWLNVARSIAMPVWIVVWIWPAIMSVIRWHRLKRSVEDSIKEARSRVESDES